MKHIEVVDNFYKSATQLRKHFEERFGADRARGAESFCWDFFHVEGQYTHLRTPAYSFFPKKLYEDFHNRLLKFGQEKLGCYEISPPWLSLYVDGCEQRLHADHPHGPFAYVYSLTAPGSLRFEGGETLIFKPDFLDQLLSLSPLHEEAAWSRAILSKFNRLTVFNPWLPHGVSRVSGTKNPLFGRLVIHGWFVKARPYFDGAAPVKALQNATAQLEGEIAQLLSNDSWRGSLIVRFSVAKSGRSTVKILANSLLNLRLDPSVARAEMREILNKINRWQAPRSRSAYTLTLPLIFD
jgi:hypothetical protein